MKMFFSALAFVMGFGFSSSAKAEADFTCEMEGRLGDPTYKVLVMVSRIELDVFQESRNEKFATIQRGVTPAQFQPTNLEPKIVCIEIRNGINLTINVYDKFVHVLRQGNFRPIPLQFNIQ